jgi:hypothetical protein
MVSLLEGESVDGVDLWVQIVGLLLLLRMITLCLVDGF